MEQDKYIREHAIVLTKTPYQEKHLLVQLLTKNRGRISTIALNAQNSKKRFGPALQPGHYVMANLGRHSQSNDSLLRLDSVDLKDSFLHLRASYQAIDAMAFFLAISRDLIPESDPDESVFVAVGRVLRDSKSLDFSKHAAWSKLALWCWWAHHLGFGDLSESLHKELKAYGIEGVWHKVLAQDQPHFIHLFEVLSSKVDKDLPASKEKLVYADWFDASGVSWSYLEKSAGGAF